MAAASEMGELLVKFQVAHRGGIRRRYGRQRGRRQGETEPGDVMIYLAAWPTESVSASYRRGGQTR